MSTEPTPGSTTPRTHPLQRDIRSPGTWNYLVNYVVLGAAAALILLEIIDSGAWRKLGLSLLLILVANFNLARLQAAERKHAAPGT